MENNIKITYPGSEKVYIKGSLHPEIKVGMRVVKQMPTVSIENGKRIERKNPSVYIYDTSGPYSDPSIKTDVRKGLPRLREPWIMERGGVERLKEISSEYGRMRRDDRSLDSLRFEHITLPLRAKRGCEISQMYYARQGIVTPEMEHELCRAWHQHPHHPGIRTRRSRRRTCRDTGKHQSSRIRADDYRH